MTGQIQATVEVRAFNRLRFIPETGCLEWTGALDRHGYGRINVGGRAELVHRLMYRLWVGEIPEKLSIDHLCRNTKCAAPDHLEAVTHSENTRRQQEALVHHNAKKAHCPQGHPYDEENTRYATRGTGRVCRVCRAESSRLYRLRKKTRS